MGDFPSGLTQCTTKLPTAKWRRCELLTSASAEVAATSTSGNAGKHLNDHSSPHKRRRVLHSSADGNGDLGCSEQGKGPTYELAF
jgi:hypothetical protein